MLLSCVVSDIAFAVSFAVSFAVASAITPSYYTIKYEFFAIGFSTGRYLRGEY